MTLIKISVDVEEDLIARFREIYPQHGAMKWFVNECLRYFTDIHDPEKIDEEIRESVERSLKLMEDG